MRRRDVYFHIYAICCTRLNKQIIYYYKAHTCEHFLHSLSMGGRKNLQLCAKKIVHLFVYRYIFRICALGWMDGHYIAILVHRTQNVSSAEWLPIDWRTFFAKVPIGLRLPLRLYIRFFKHFFDNRPH